VMVPAARLELARLAAADFESATSTDFVTRARGAGRRGALWQADRLCHAVPWRHVPGRGLNMPIGHRFGRGARALRESAPARKETGT
jgi:hypothetical protein